MGKVKAIQYDNILSIELVQDNLSETFMFDCLDNADAMSFYYMKDNESIRVSFIDNLDPYRFNNVKLEDIVMSNTLSYFSIGLVVGDDRISEHTFINPMIAYEIGEIDRGNAFHDMLTDKDLASITIEKLSGELIRYTPDDIPDIIARVNNLRHKVEDDYLNKITK